MSTASRTLSDRARSRRRRLVVTAALALSVSAALAGCTTTSGSHSAPASASATTVSPRTSPTPTSPAGTGLHATRLSVACSTLAPSATVSASYSGMVADTTPKAPPQSDAEVIADDGGTLCSWTDSATGDTMALAAGQYSDASLTRLKNALVTSSNQVPTYQGEGYFSLTGKTGTAEAFTGAYWVVVIGDSDVFIEPGGAEPLVDAALAALKARG